jgi:hypothetical protein
LASVFWLSDNPTKSWLEAAIMLMSLHLSAYRNRPF